MKALRPCLDMVDRLEIRGREDQLAPQVLEAIAGRLVSQLLELKTSAEDAPPDLNSARIITIIDQSAALVVRLPVLQALGELNARRFEAAVDQLRANLKLFEDWADPRLFPRSADLADRPPHIRAVVRGGRA